MTHKNKTLARYRAKFPKTKLAPGQKNTLRRKTLRPVTTAKPTPSLKREFLVFCIKRILNSGGLVYKEGANWRLVEPISGIDPGEKFISLDSCANTIASALEHAFENEGRAAA